MKYICHKRYKKTGVSGKEYNFKRETELETIGNYIACDNAAVCSIQSEDAYIYFARNDDGNGLERGELTHAIAYSNRHPNETDGYRFTDEEREMLAEEYPQFLRQDTDTIIFNYDFFNADIEVLREMANRLEVS